MTVHHFLLGVLCLFTSSALLSGCDDAAGKTPTSSAALLPVNDLETAQRVVLPSWQPGDFDRESIVANMKAKLAAKQPLVAHIFVPLCDNENQGIVPVNASLGNGQNLRTNLYWGAGYGMATHFKRSADWQLVAESVPPEAHILQRLVFKKQFPGGGPLVYLIADAYDGAYMQTAIEDYLDALAGAKTGTVQAGDATVSGWAGADLLALNGHNGLMDEDVSPRKNVDGRHRDAVVVACFSHSYFESYLAKAGGYPLLTTTHLLAPEAYVMRAAIDAWAMQKSGSDIRLDAGKAYHQYQKCGLKGATNLFHSGWSE